MRVFTEKAKHIVYYTSIFILVLAIIVRGIRAEYEIAVLPITKKENCEIK